MSTTVLFRLAGARDLESILMLLADDEVAQGRGHCSAELTPDVRAAFDEIQSDPNNELWVGELDNQIVAMAHLTFIPGLSRGGMRRALVEAVRVPASQRGQGIGSALMNRLEARARERNCGLIQLTTDRKREAAHRFYERLGYQASHLGMKKSLSPKS